MTVSREGPLAHLALADPALADTVADGLKQRENPLPPADLAAIVEEILWGVSQEISLGEAVAEGYARLLGQGPSGSTDRYGQLVRQASETGPTLATLMARHAVPVLITADPALLDRFLARGKSDTVENKYKEFAVFDLFRNY